VLVFDGKRYRGPSHFQAMMKRVEETGNDVLGVRLSEPKEGFETESGHFLDRKQSADYALTKSEKHELIGGLTAEALHLAAVDGQIYTQDAVQAAEHDQVFAPVSERESTLAHHRIIRDEARHAYQQAVNRAIATLELQAVADLKRKETERVKKKRREEELDAIALLLFLAGERIYQSTSLKLASLLGQNATLTPLQAQPGTSLEGQPGATPTGEQAGTGGGGPLPAGTEEAEAFASIRQPLLVNFPRESAERLDQVTEEGRAAGKNDKEVARDLEEKAQEIEGGQGSVVAETEATATLGLAQLRLLQRAGFATCAWDQLDRPTKRETHFQNTLEGEVSVGHVFGNGQVCPGDASQGPGETVSCLCTLIGVKRKPGTGHLQASEPVKATAHDVNGLDWSYDYVQGSFEENKHPRGDKGTDKGGQFTSKGGGIGLKRFGEGKESKWVTHEGKDMPEHAKTLGIPPAWQNVRVAPGPEHDLQAIGHDKKGREQRIYSEAFTQRQAALKFSRNKELIEKQKDIFAQNEENLKSEHQDIVEQAACMKLIQATGIRPGSDTDTKGEKQAYGATTLEGRHVVEQDGKVRLVFVGKKGVSLDILVDDESVAAMLVERKKKSGNDGKLFNTDDAKLRNYSHTLDGGSFKPKDFRTLKGTITAMDEIKSDPNRSDSLKEFKKRVMAVAKKVADVLGNTPIIALQSYINPFVFESWKPVMQ
jgi:DNA topoisomerase-1